MRSSLFDLNFKRAKSTTGRNQTERVRKNNVKSFSIPTPG